MRQNTRNIKIHSLLKEKKKTPIPERKFKTVIIPGDIKRTQFIVPIEKDSNAVIQKYLDSRKY
jgi:hypothetical protein